MSVHCQVLDRSKNQLGDTVQVGCFGFLYNLTAPTTTFNVNMDEFKSAVKFMRYFVNPIEGRLDEVIVNDYLNLLEEIGISKVLQYEGKLTYASARNGIDVDLEEQSGQMFIGALELVRNITYHTCFVSLVVKLWKDGISPEVALWLPRFLRTQAGRPGADASGYTMENLVQGSSSLFDDASLEKKKKEFLPWKELGTFTGVHQVYRGTGKAIPINKYVNSMAYRANLWNEVLIAENSLLTAMGRQREIQFLNTIYGSSKLEYDKVLEICQYYEQHGTL